MLKLFLRRVWHRVRTELPTTVLLAGAIVAAWAVVLWAFDSALDARSFVFGYATAAATLFLYFRSPNQATDDGPRADPSGYTLARQEVELNYSKWAARRAKLECRRLRRELREPDWNDGHSPS